MLTVVRPSVMSLFRAVVIGVSRTFVVVGLLSFTLCHCLLVVWVLLTPKDSALDSYLFVGHYQGRCKIYSTVYLFISYSSTFICLASLLRGCVVLWLCRVHSEGR